MPGQSAVKAMPATYRPAWHLFVDWCAAVERASLPAHPRTLAQFLAEHPAAAATQRHRIAAINRAHRAAEQPLPGRAGIIRAFLAGPAATDPEQLAAAHAALELIPTFGWPSGYFGRRDALLIVLSTVAHLRPVDISRLQRSDLRTDGTSLIVAGGHDLVLPAGDDPLTSPAAVYLRWARTQSFVDHYPSTVRIAKSFAKTRPVKPDDPKLYEPAPEIRDGRDGPLIPPIDRYGQLPALCDPQMLAPASVAAIVRAHLSGCPPRYVTAPPPVDAQAEELIDDGGREDPDAAVASAAEEQRAWQEDRRYEEGIAARHRAAASMQEATDQLEEIEDKADELLRRTLELLEAMNA